MNRVLELVPIARRAFEQAQRLLAPDPTDPPDLAVYAAYWLRFRCHASGPSFLSSLVANETNREILERLDLHSLSVRGFLVGAGLLKLDAGAESDLKAALDRLTRRRPHTDELSGPADDPLCLLGLWLLASAVATQTAIVLLSWMHSDGLSPALRAAFVLAGALPATISMSLDTSPQSLAAYLLTAFADPERSAMSCVESSEVVSQLVTMELDGRLSRGDFGALSVLVAFELILQDAEARRNTAVREPTLLDLPAEGREDASSFHRSAPMTLDEADSRGMVIALARTITTNEQAVGVLRAIGFPSERMPSFSNFSTPLDYWRRVCTELHNGVVRDGLARLLAAAGREYPDNPAFKAAGGEARAAATFSANAPASHAQGGALAPIAILLVFANPRGTDALRLGTEERAVREALRLATNRDRFTLTVLHAATIDDLRRALLRGSYDIVQFSGHASVDGLQFEDVTGDIVEADSEALAELLHRRSVKAVVLNACDSLSAGLAASARIEYTIAMNDAVEDRSSIEFTRGFFDALGEGLDIEGAFAEGVSCCRLKRMPVNAVLLRKGEKPGGVELGSSDHAVRRLIDKRVGVTLPEPGQAEPRRVVPDLVVESEKGARLKPNDCSRASRSPLEQLTELLADLFEQKELRHFLHFGPDGDRVVRSLHFEAARAEVSYQAVEVLRRLGRIDEAFFERLRKERGNRVAEIDVVAQAWLGQRAAVVAATHVVVLEAAIAGQVSAVDDGQIHAALGACSEVGRLRLDLHDLETRDLRAVTWSEGQARIQAGVQEFLRTTVLPSGVRHVSVFGLAPIPWLMALGYALSETVEARVHQRLRVPSTWCWQPHMAELGDWRTQVVHEAPEARDVAVLVSASARVQLARVDDALSPAGRATYELSLDEPALDAVRSADQLAAFGTSYRALLARIEREQPRVERVHVFAAAPVAVAVECGRKLLHSGDPPVVAYQLHERRYVRALELRP